MEKLYTWFNELHPNLDSDKTVLESLVEAVQRSRSGITRISDLKFMETLCTLAPCRSRQE